MPMVRGPLSPTLPIFLTSLCSGRLGGMVIGLAPVLNFGSPELKAKVHCPSRFLNFFQVHIFLDRSGSIFGQEVHVLPFRRRTQVAMYWG
jgi:hypothetical protein